VNLVARQPIAGAKRHNAIAQRTFELLKALEFGFASREIDERALHRAETEVSSSAARMRARR
jgi:hypothetical protein